MAWLLVVVKIYHALSDFFACSFVGWFVFSSLFKVILHKKLSKIHIDEL